MVAIPRDPPPGVPGLRTLGTGATDAAAGNDSRFVASGALTIKVAYNGTPASQNIFYMAEDLAGNILTPRDTAGVTESVAIPGFYTYDQVVSLDQFVAIWDENDPAIPPYRQLVATRHPVHAPSAATAVVAVGGDEQATISFTPGDNGGSAITSYTVVAIDATSSGRGGQTQSGARSPLIVTGLTNGDSYTFAVTAHTAFGDSPAATSNSVTPAMVLHVPDAPTGVSAVVSGSGQVTVTFTPPVNNGGSTITSYLVSAVDETNSSHNKTHVGNSPNVVTALVNGEAYHFTVHATNAVGNSVESVASNTVTPAGSGGTATFTVTPVGGLMYLLDSAGSTGTLTWNVDGIDSPTTTPTLLIGPLRVGLASHHVKLTAVAGGAGITERDIDVAWVARPLGKAQHDPTNGSPSGGGAGGYWGVPRASHLATELPQFADQPVLAPWRNYQVLNMVEGYPGAGDGVERVHVFDDNHISILCRYGDHPTSSGGDRESFEMSNAYMQNQDWSSSTVYNSGRIVRSAGAMYTSLQNANLNHTPASSPTWWQVYSEYAEMHSFEVCGQNIQNNNTIDGHSTAVRFYRISFLLPTGTPNPLLYQNNFYELYGVSDGAILFGPNGAGTQVGWTARSKLLGVSGKSNLFDYANIQINVWYHYVAEVVWNTDPTVGYIRLYRDYGTGAGMALVPFARCPVGTKGKSPDTTPSSSPDYGKLFYATQQTNQSGTPVLIPIDLENYRDKNGLDAYYAANGTPYSDVTLEVKNSIVGPTMASVMI